MTIPNKTTAPYLKPLIVNSIISRQPPITEFRLSGLLKHSLHTDPLGATRVYGTLSIDRVCFQWNSTPKCHNPSIACGCINPHVDADSGVETLGYM